MSNHPLNKSTIINEANLRSIHPSKISEISDGEAGVTGTIDGQRVMWSRADWLISEGVEIRRPDSRGLRRVKEGRSWLKRPLHWR